MRSPHRLLLTLAILVPVLAVSSVAAATTNDEEPGPQVLVVNGTPATESYPFMVYVDGCTGSLVKANWAVTAKHCPTPGTVRVGSIDRTTGGTVVPVSRAVENPSIDVKLLQLATPVSHAPAPIPTTSGPVGTATRIIGWGQTCATINCGVPPAVAHEMDTSIVADSRCSGIDGPFEICTDNNGGSGACYGDSGGPQVRAIDGVWSLIGVTSRSGNSSSTCATAPSIYGDLPSIRSWIDAEVGGLSTPVAPEPEPGPAPDGNLAVAAAASASYTSSWESVAAINDGIDPTASDDTANPRWGTWPITGEQWTELSWSTSQTVRSVWVYFLDDNAIVHAPASWRLQYFDGTGYVDVPDPSGYPIAVDQYNKVTFAPLSTTALRVVLQSGEGSVGILEIKVFG